MITIPNLKSDQRDLNILNNYLVRINGKELNSLYNPCYKPTMIKYMADLRKLTGIQQKEMDLFFNNLTARYAADFNILKNDITAIIIIAMVFYARKKEYKIVESLYILLSIRFYTNRFSKHWMKYCKEDTWDLALRNISQKHLFKIRNGISNSILYLSQEEFIKSKSILENKNMTDKDLIDTIYRIRHRIAQSVRSFANRYYDIEDSEDNQKNIDKTKESLNVITLSQNISEIICTYSQIDKKSLDIAISRSRIRKDLSINIINSISQIQHKDSVKFIIILMSKIINMKDICTKQSFLIRKIVADTQKIGTYSIKKEILNLVDSCRINETNSINKDQLTLLISFYITTYIQNKIC